MATPKEVIKSAEEMIESAMWDAIADEDSKRELERYKKAESLLLSLTDLSPDEDLEQKRVLSYCLMRMDEALSNLGETEGSLNRAERYLQLAIESGDLVQIARSRLAVGIRLLNEGDLRNAEMHFADIITGGIDSDDSEMQQVVGWTLLVRANILKGKSLYEQAVYVAEDAAGILSRVENYRGLEQVYSLMSKLYVDLGNPDKADEMNKMSKAFGVKGKELHK
ncbi:MAG: hypothetical protein ACFFEJ_01430 [Candidatus Thorarchaeota archaeon]